MTIGARLGNSTTACAGSGWAKARLRLEGDRGIECGKNAIRGVLASVEVQHCTAVPV